MGTRGRPLRLYAKVLPGSLTRSRESLDKQVKRSTSVRENLALLRGSAFAFYHDSAKEIARTLGVSVTLSELKEWFGKGVSLRKVRSILVARERRKKGL